MEPYLLVYNTVICSLLIIILINYINNNFLFNNVLKYHERLKLSARLPLVSVLVPARNEEKGIERCIRSLMRQDYPNLEIIVLDDNSTDGTASIIRKLSRESDRVRMLEGKTLPPGWVGKNYGCYQLEKEARGDYLLFTDADTVHQKRSVSSAFFCLREKGLDAISVFPYQVTRSIMEKMIIRYMNLGILMLIPLKIMQKTSQKLFSTALGSFMLYKRKVYQAVGGHTSIGGQCLEDINMSILLKKMGYSFMVFDGTHTYRTRMYDDFPSIIKGVKRFVLTTFNFNASMGFLSMLFLSMLMLFPFLLLPLSILAGAGSETYIPNLLVNSLQVLIVVSIRTAYAVRFRGSFSEVLLHPVSIGLLLILSIYINLNPRKGQCIDWKGRKYTLQQQHI